MTWTRERKLLLAILGLGALALIVDRAVLSSGTTGPNDVAADATVAASTTQATPLAQLNENDALALLAQDDARPMLSERLKATARAEALSAAAPRDAFEPAASWVGEPESTPASTRSTQTAMADPVQRFRQAHNLIAVMTNRGDGVAIVNGRTVRVGEQIDGFTLERVERRRAVFAADGVRTELTVVQGE